MAKGFGVSPFTNTIYYGTCKKSDGMCEFTGKKEDVTDGAIKAVFEWFIGNMEENESEEFSLTFTSTDYELVMRRKGRCLE